jgi:hypothetical protein
MTTKMITPVLFMRNLIVTIKIISILGDGNIHIQSEFLSQLEIKTRLFMESKIHLKTGYRYFAGHNPECNKVSPNSLLKFSAGLQSI